MNEKRFPIGGALRAAGFAGCVLAWLLIRRRPDFSDSSFFYIAGSMMLGSVALAALALQVWWLTSCPPSIRGLGHHSSQLKTLEALVKQGTDAVPLLLRALYAPRGKLGFARCVAWDGDLICRSAMEGLARLRSAQAVMPLLEFLNDRDQGLREKVVESLGMIGDTRAVPRIIEFLHECSETGRLVAVEALGRLHDPRSFDKLKQLLTDPSYDVRVVAIKAMGEQGDASAVPLLIPLLGSETSLAAAALSKLGEGELAYAYSQVMHGDPAAVSKLRGVWPREIAAALLAQLNGGTHKSPQAAWALGELHVVSALPELKARTGLLSLVNTELKDACREAIEKLEAFAALPRPAESTLDTHDLPRASVSPKPLTDRLPRVSAGDEVR